jgi:AcrR family transcriptional regulator
MPRSRRKPAPHAEVTRTRIVEAAVKAFADKGFEAASTREIAQAAGVEQGLLTYHFPTKDVLWRAAADQVFGVLRGNMMERLAGLEGTSPGERAREGIRTYVRTMASHPEFFRFIVDQGNRSDARQRWLVDTHIKPAFEGAKRAGVFRALGAGRKEQLPHALFAMVGAGSLIFAVPNNCRRLTGVDPRKPEAIEAHADFVANLLFPRASRSGAS